MELLGRKVHPVAEMFPLMEGKEFEELVEDIRKNGLRTPILVHPDDGSILDGRNRGRACPAAGVEPRFETWDGKGSVVELILSLNVRRRHLNESQRAMAAARLKEQLAAEITTGRPGRETMANLPSFRPGAARDQAASMLNVSARLVQDAVRVLKSGNAELIHEVDSGKLSVSAAARKLAPPRAPTAAGPAPKHFAIPELGPGDAALLLWGPWTRLAKVLAGLESLGVRHHRLGP